MDLPRSISRTVSDMIGTLANWPAVERNGAEEPPNSGNGNPTPLVLPHALGEIPKLICGLGRVGFVVLFSSIYIVIVTA